MRVERLARDLRALGVVAEAWVAIAAERSFDRVVGLLGILKAGAGYLPLDPNYPAERLAHMLRDSRARWLICQETLAEPLPCPAEAARLPLCTAARPATAESRAPPHVPGGARASVA